MPALLALVAVTAVWGYTFVPMKDAVAVYPLGDGSDWVASFAADLTSGRFGGGP